MAPKKSELKILCPTGHKLPFVGPEGECTPLRCGGPHASSTPANKVADAEMTALAFAPKKDRVNSAVAAKEVRGELMRKIDVEDGKELEAAQAVMTKAAPLAVAELLYQLEYGNDKQRGDMALELLDRVGLGRKGEGGSGFGGPIITLVLPNGMPPWAPGGQTVDAAAGKKGGDNET